MKYYILAFKNFTNFSGRSTRPEFWYFFLINFIFFLSTNILALFYGEIIELVELIYIVITFIPSLALTIRRLHDINKSGWWILISLVPFIGSIILLVILSRKGTTGPNNFGQDPNSITQNSNPITQ